MRHPRTTQERRMNQEGWQRAKRNHLSDAWDDFFPRPKGCWKKYRKKQYRRGSIIGNAMETTNT